MAGLLLTHIVQFGWLVHHLAFHHNAEQVQRNGHSRVHHRAHPDKLRIRYAIDS
jgi:hypothetical protein